MTRVGAGAFSASLVSVALLGSGAGIAFAQEADDCDLNGYPPEQCTTQGGASAGAPPLVVNRTLAAPGDPVTVTGTGCPANADVTLELLRVAKPGGGRQSIGSTKADADGGFDISAAIPADSVNGVYLLYSTCTDLNGFPQLRITSFVVAGQPATTGNSRTAAQRTATPEQDAEVFAAAVADADLPEQWSAPDSWQDSPATKAAISRAVNLELAALRSSLPATDVAAPTTPVATDTTPWAAGAAGAVFLLLGAAGWRRHAAKASTTDEVAL